MVTSKEKANASDGLDNYPSRIEGVARSLNSKFDGKLYRNREQGQKLHIGIWSVTSLTGKEPKLVEEAIRYRLDIVGVSSTKRKGSGTLILNKRWQLFYAGADPALHSQAGLGILTNLRLAERVVEWRSSSERVVLLRLKLKEKTLTVVQTYAANIELEYVPCLDKVFGVVEGISETEVVVLKGDFNADVGKDAQTWKERRQRQRQQRTRQVTTGFLSQWKLVHNEYVFFPHKDIHKYIWFRLGIRPSKNH